MTTEFKQDWRSGAYGGNLLAHVFVFGFGQSRKAPACGIKGGPKYVHRLPYSDTRYCSECLRRVNEGTL